MAETLEASPVEAPEATRVPTYRFTSTGSRQVWDAAAAPTPPAPYPQDAFGIPIEETDSILDTEALTL